MERVSSITHPSGKSLPFCERLTNFVMSRPKEHPFLIGHWFQSLEDKDLIRVQKLAHAVLEDRQNEFEDFEVDDVVGLVTIAASVETEDRMSFGPADLHDLVGALLMVSGVSYMSRLGWRLHIQRKGSKDKPISAAKERRNHRIAKTRARIASVA